MALLRCVAPKRDGAGHAPSTVLQAQPMGASCFRALPGGVPRLFSGWRRAARYLPHTLAFGASRPSSSPSESSSQNRSMARCHELHLQSAKVNLDCASGLWRWYLHRRNAFDLIRPRHRLDRFGHSASSAE